MLSVKKKQKLNHALELLNLYMDKRLASGYGASLTHKQRKDLFALCDALDRKILSHCKPDDRCHGTLEEIREKVILANQISTEMWNANKRDVFKNVLQETVATVPEKVQRSKWDKTSFFTGMSTGVAVAFCATIWLNTLPVSSALESFSEETVALFAEQEVDRLLGITNKPQEGVYVFDSITAKALQEEYNTKNIDWQAVKAHNYEDTKDFFVSFFDKNYIADAEKRVDNIGVDLDLPLFLQALNQKAIEGSIKAQFDLGMAYVRASEEDIWRSVETAEFWLKQAANNEHAAAQYNLAVLYQQGLIKDVEIQEIVHLYDKAAQKNYPQALFNLGLAYMNGYGVETDYKEAIDYFKQAYDEGVYKSAYILGKLYETGVLKFGEADKEQAIFWYKKAFENGVDQAEKALDDILKSSSKKAPKIKIRRG